jgi:PAS domain S-box-containing protein
MIGLKNRFLQQVQEKSMISEFVKAFELANADLIILSSPNAVIVEITSPVLRRWNCLKDDMVGKSLKKYGAGLLSARFHGEGTGQKIEISYTPPLGNPINSVFRTQKISDGQHEFLMCVAERTSNEEIERAINNEKRLNMAMRSGGYALWDHDFETGITYNSPEMEDTFGYGQSDRKLDFNSFNELVHPDDKTQTLSEKISKLPFGQEIVQSRYRVRSKVGKYIWIESVAYIVRDPMTGLPSKCVGLCRNIDDQMVGLDRLKTSERTLKRTQAAAQLGSFALRVDSGVSRLTAELAELIGLGDAMVHPNLKTFVNMIEPGDRERFSEALELAKLGRVIKNLEIAVKTKSGNLQWFQVTMEPERNNSQEVESVFGCCQCVTERKGLERKFHQAQKMEAVGQLTGGIAHDFNNLLMVVMGNLQLVEQLVSTNEKATKRIRAAIDAAEKGSDLTRRMLAFSRQQTLHNKEVPVNDMLFRMQDMLKQAVTAIVDLKIIPGTDVWPVKADVTMLETAILNLAINARDAMKPKGGSLVIETSNRVLDANYCKDIEDVQPGDYVEIAVTDTGTGIAAENIEKVFQPFFTTKGPEAGSGLGLSMIYGFVKQSGGHIKIYSEVGHGTTMKLYLPKLREKPVVVAPQKPTELQEQLSEQLKSVAVPVASQKMRVLVVEDNDQVRDVASAMVEDMGFEVITATNGVDGLKMIETDRKIDLLLSDVIMAGGMNGPELAAKAIKVRPELKVLFMSGYAPGSVRQMQDLPDTIDLVNKPFTRSDLTAKVMKALTQSAAVAA